MGILITVVVVAIATMIANGDCVLVIVQSTLYTPFHGILIVSQQGIYYNFLIYRCGK